MKMKSSIVFRICFIILLCCFYTVLAGGHCAEAAEQTQPSEQEYQTRYDNAVGLAELLRTSPDMLHNKLYTAEQEVELQALVDSVCSGKASDRAKAEALLVQIFNQLEPGPCYELNGWDTLCDGDSDCVNTSGEIVGKKKTVNEEAYCFTFYDVCRLAGIPCFVLEDCQASESNNRYIAMVYVEPVSGSGKEWFFVDVAAERLQLVSREYAYETFGTEIYPSNLVLDYDKALYFRNVISLSRDSRVTSKEAPKLVYDSVSNAVKVYFTTGRLAAGEQYYMTETFVGEDGVAPSGWIQTKDYSAGTVKTYRSYTVCGVFLRGRVTIGGKEVELQTDDFLSFLSYYDHQAVGSEPESEEHKKFVLDYKKRLEDKAIACAEALLADQNYIWNDTYFSTEEDEKLVQEAVDTALDWNYIKEYEASEIAFKTADIPFKSWEEQSSVELRDKAKAQAILLYIKRNVKSVDHGPNYVNSATVLKQKVGTCEGFSRLYRDMCVMAGVPCFKLSCSLGMRMGDTLFRDHGDNLIKAGDKWLFCDAMGAIGVIGKGDNFQMGIFEGYDTANSTEIYLDNDAFRKNTYAKWTWGTSLGNYFDFDSEGKLGIYHRNRYGEPVPDSETDENGRYTMENGLQNVDILEKSEDGSAEVVTRYAYYYQNLRTLQGRKTINGTEYNFDTDVRGVSAKCHKLQEVSRRYVISKLTFQPIADQPFDPDGVCPVPEIYHGDKKLEYGKDFNIVEYKHNKELTTYADASYQVEGIGDYTGNAIRYFKIVKADISEREVTLAKTSVSWSPDVEARKPRVDVGLTSQDYSVAYYDYDKIGRARVVITGKGNYQGTVTKEYDIKPGVWNDETLQIQGNDGKPLQSKKFYYRFSPVAAEVKVCWRDENGRDHLLSEADDYELSYSGTEHPGTGTVTVTAKGNYEGSSTCTYEIMPYFVWEDDIKAEYTQTVYNGLVQKPAVTIQGSGGLHDMVEGIDFFITYEKKVNGAYQEAEPKEAGEYRIVVRVSGDMAIMKEGIEEEEASDVCYISYTIQAGGTGGSGSGGGGTESSGDVENGTGGSGSSGGETGGSSPGTGGSGNGGNGQSGISDPCGTSNNKNDTVKKLKLTARKNAIKVSWGKERVAKGYQIQISRYKNYKKARTVNVKKSKVSYMFKKLKKNTKYYIRIRIYIGTVRAGESKKMVYGKWKKATQKIK